GNFISASIERPGVYSLRPYSESEEDLSGLLVYPNPFDPVERKLNVSFNLKKEGSLIFEVYTLTGDLVYREEKFFSSGPGRVFRWDGKNARGSQAANGMYYARIREGRSEIDNFLIGVLK
ncbi:MAG: hypothetical protein ACQESB_04945, partial [Elusimicrobiota bacterium]